MSQSHDIYDPPPVPAVEWTPPRAEPLIFTRGDLACLILLFLSLLVAALIFWREEPVLALISAGAGALIVLESWLTTLGFLYRRHATTLKLRWTIFLAALIPWLIGLSVAVGLILGLFWIADHWFQ